MPEETLSQRAVRVLVTPFATLWQSLSTDAPASEPPPETPVITQSAQYGGMGERELELRMEQVIERIHSSRHNVLEPARKLAAFSQPEQKRFLEAGERLAHSNTELAYQFFHFALPSLQALEDAQWEAWLDLLLDHYNTGGVNSAVRRMRTFDAYLTELRGNPAGIHLADVTRLLESLLAGFGGRALRVEPARTAEPYTDTATAFLPERVDVCGSRAENFDLLKAMAAHLWAQARFGTYRVDLSRLEEYPDIARARRLYHALEAIRLQARLNHEMPGIGRILERHMSLAAWAALSPEWAAAVARLSAAHAAPEETLEALRTLYNAETSPPAVAWQGVLRPELARSAMATRMEIEREALGNALSELRADGLRGDGNTEAEGATSVQVRTDPEEVGDEFAFSLEFGDEQVPPPPDMQQLLESIMQDRGEIPDEYLEPAGAGAYNMEPGSATEEMAQSTVPVTDAVYYPEWDHARQKYRVDWCRLYERSIDVSSEEFVLATESRHRRLIPSLRRTFEALREDEGHCRGETHGDEIDLDRFLQAYGDYRNGHELAENLYLRRRRLDRDVAAMFLVDMSGSTAGWVNDMVRESLVLLCCALETLDDRYAIYGFSGNTRENCELYPIKLLNERYDATVRARIAGIAPKEYTRLGVMIRHLTQLLRATEARSRLLITLSDGKPDDQDGYRGAYGIEDTRQALHEARHAGIHPFCITIDEQAMEYLPHMYGDTGFTVVNRIDLLPRKVSGIYRRLTT